MLTTGRGRVRGFALRFAFMWTGGRRRRGEVRKVWYDWNDKKMGGGGRMQKQQQQQYFIYLDNIHQDQRVVAFQIDRVAGSDGFGYERDHGVAGPFCVVPYRGADGILGCWVQAVEYISLELFWGCGRA